MSWQVGALANLVLLVVYLAIAFAIMIPLLRDGDLRDNQLGTATALIFLTCAVGHGGFAVRALLPAAGVGEGSAVRIAFDPGTAVWDVATAAVGVYYWSLRRSYGSLLHGAKLFVDLRERQRRALEINDGIVQGLATAKLALELDQRDVSREALESTLAAARGLITDLLGEAQAAAQLHPGDLRRSQAAAIRSP